MKLAAKWHDEAKKFDESEKIFAATTPRSTPIKTIEQFEIRSTTLDRSGPLLFWLW
jgi:hypothetical protein